MHTIIRGDFIQRYAERKNNYLQSSWQMIQDRDIELRELNRAFGYSEPDGSFGIGCKTHVDQNYKRKYDAIETRFRAPYDDQLPGLHRWCIEQGMTVYECLLLDNIWDDDLKAIAERTETVEDWQLRPIGEKARLMVSRWKKEHSIGEIGRRVRIEKSHFGYAAARCRKELNIGVFDVSRQKAIFDYGQEWKKALDSAFSSLRAA